MAGQPLSALRLQPPSPPLSSSYMAKEWSYEMIALGGDVFPEAQ
jgi:hypothetical protein